MTWSKRALLSLALAACCAAPATAQVIGHPVEFSGGAGYFHFDTRDRMMDGPAYTGALGLRLTPWMTLEGQATFGPTKADSVPDDLKHNFSYAGLDARWDLRPPEGHVVPFLLTGVGVGQSHTTGTPPERLRRGAGNVGMGVLWNLGLEDQRIKFSGIDVQ